ncbi:MAG: T9SS type A sorting domain-containing protein [Chitinophagales bacterium]
MNSFLRLMGLLCLLFTSYSLKAQVDSLQIAGQSFCQRSIQPVQGLILSEEIGVLDGIFQLHFDIDVITDSMNITEPIDIQLPIDAGVPILQNIQLPNLVGTYHKEDRISETIPISYNSVDLPYYPQAVQINIPYNNLLNGEEKILNLYAYIYFTPYNTIEIWNPADFYGQRRVWIEPYGVIPERRYIPRDSIPTSNLPLHLDSLHVWEEDWNYELIEGLAYAIPFRRLNYEEDDEGNKSNQKSDGCTFLRRRFRYNMTGTLLGDNTTKRDDPAAFANVALAGLEVKLYEDDFDIFGSSENGDIPGVIDDQLFDFTMTNDDGSFDMSFNRCQTKITEGMNIELFMVIKAHNPTYDIKAKSWITGGGWQELPFFTRRSVIVLGDFPYLDGEQGTIADADYNIGMNHAHKSVSYCKLAMDYVNESLAEDIPGSFTIWPDAFGSSFFFPNNLGFLDWTPFGLPSALNLDGKPAIYLSSDGSGEEDVTYHEFGHYVMWQLQNENWIDPITGSFANHSMVEESNPRITWTEGWANALAVILDMVFYSVDEEYDRDAFTFSNGTPGVHVFEVNPFYPLGNVDQGYLSEHYFACAINDLFDGPTMVDYGIPSVTAKTHNDDATGSWGSELDELELSFQEICQPIIDHAGLTGKLHDVDDYYRALIHGKSCHERREIKRTFDNNRITDLTSLPATAFSSDGIGFEHQHCFGLFNIHCEEFTLDINRLSTATNFASFNVGYSTNASTWLSDDLLIENNGSLTFNANAELDNVLVDIAPLYTPQAFISSFYLFPQPEAHIEVDLCGGMNMIVGNDGFVTLGDNGIATTAEVRVNAGSTLTLGANSNLIIREGSKVIIERGGNLEISPNANIVLEGDNSVLDIRGNLTLLPQAIFTFTGNGFVRFDLPNGPAGWSHPNIVMNSNSGFGFQGTGKTDKIIEIADNSYFSPPWTDPTLTFSWQHGKVLLGTNVHIQTTNCLTTLKDLQVESLGGGQYNAFFLSGKNGSTFNDMNVSGGNVGLFYVGSHADGASAVMNDIEIHHCNIGLKTLSRGANLTAMNLHHNSIGWEAEGMTLPSYLNSSIVTNNNSTNIFYDGSISSPLSLNDCTITNSIVGIHNVGASMIHAHCGKINFHSIGILLNNMGGVDMSSLNNQGNVYLRDNLISIEVTPGILLSDIQIDEGLNSFENNVFALNGFVDASGTNNALSANSNAWFTPGSPQYGDNYKLEDFTSSVAITLTDISPITKNWQIDPQCGAKSANLQQTPSINYITNIRGGLEQFGKAVLDNQPTDYDALLIGLDQQLKQARQSSDDKAIAKYTVEKALVYHLKNKHGAALDLLVKIPADMPTRFAAYIEKWHCILSADIAAQEGKLNSIAYEKQRSNCGHPIYATDTDLMETYQNLAALAKNVETQIRVYPNPNKGQFDVFIEGPTKDIAAMGLYDFSGKLVADLIQDGETGNQHTFDGQNLPEGIYFLKVTTHTQTLVKKVLIAR